MIPCSADESSRVAREQRARHRERPPAARERVVDEAHLRDGAARRRMLAPAAELPLGARRLKRRRASSTVAGSAAPPCPAGASAASVAAGAGRRRESGAARRGRRAPGRATPPSGRGCWRGGPGDDLRSRHASARSARGSSHGRQPGVVRLGGRRTAAPRRAHLRHARDCSTTRRPRAARGARGARARLSRASGAGRILVRELLCSWRLEVITTSPARAVERRPTAHLGRRRRVRRHVERRRAREPAMATLCGGAPRVRAA